MNVGPLIATVIGDPAGVGPEVCVKALATGKPQGLAQQVLIGDVEVLERANAVCGTSLRFAAIRRIDQIAPDLGAVPVLEVDDVEIGEVRSGEVSRASAHASLRWLERGIELAASGAAKGLVVAPVHSGALKDIGIDIDHPVLEPPGSYQLRMSGMLRVVPISEHVRIRDVAGLVTTAKVRALIDVLSSTLVSWGLAKPRIGVAGLNPHALYEEDRFEIAPAVAAARQAGIEVVGPVAPDAVFRQCMEGMHDAVVTMFHDQGQIAIKTAAFAGACTVFIGLPYIRIGVPHGTALELAGTGEAQALSIQSTMMTAAALARGQIDLAQTLSVAVA